MIYFDNSATTMPHKEVVAEAAMTMEKYFANPSSSHRLGLEAEKKIKAAREKVAALIGASPNELVFTSGGSEANNMAVKGLLSKGDHVIISKIEHPSIYRLQEGLVKDGYEVSLADVDSRGLINIEKLEDSIRDNTRIISIMYVNNEIGVIQPIKELVKLIRTKNRRTRIHVDAVQALGKLPIDTADLDIDMMTISAHKIHGPKGIGALYIKKGLVLKPLIIGGSQEGNLRAGTENISGIAGFGTAAEIAASSFRQANEKVKSIKEYFVKRLAEFDKIRINSPIDNNYIPHILNVSFEGIRGEVLLHALEDYNIYVSTGSACSAKDSRFSNYVLPSIGLKPYQVEGAVRFSFSAYNELSEVDETIEALKKLMPLLRRIKK